MVFDKIGLNCTQLSRISPVATQEQAPQIRHLATEKRGQFRVRALVRRKGLRERADQVTHGLIYGAIFGGGGHASRQVKANVVRIAVSVYGDLLPSAASDSERSCSLSPHSRYSCIESTCYVSYRIALLDAQLRRFSSVPPEK